LTGEAELGFLGDPQWIAAQRKRSSAMEKYVVSLDPEERVELQQLVKAGKAAARRIAHARILLLADRDDCLDEEIVSALDVSLRTVERVRKRLVTEGFDAAIDHRPQPPRPDKIKIRGNLEQKLIELACADPPHGRCRWTLRLLAGQMVVLGLVDAISLETVRQALKKMTSSRGSSKDGAFPRTPTPSLSGAWRM
jgi:Homeodomain-like domain